MVGKKRAKNEDPKPDLTGEESAAVEAPKPRMMKEPALRKPPTPAPKSTICQGTAARDPNRISRAGELRVTASTWASMARIVVTSQAGFLTWAANNGHDGTKTPTMWAAIHRDYARSPVER